MLEYLILMLFFTLSFISFAVYKRRFRALALVAVLGLVIGVPWDMIALHCFSIWSWNAERLIGVRIGGLPLEEYLFMVLLPMAIVGAVLMFKIEVHEGGREKS